MISSDLLFQQHRVGWVYDIPFFDGFVLALLSAIGITLFCIAIAKYRARRGRLPQDNNSLVLPDKNHESFLSELAKIIRLYIARTYVHPEAHTSREIKSQHGLHSLLKKIEDYEYSGYNLSIGEKDAILAQINRYMK